MTKNNTLNINTIVTHIYKIDLDVDCNKADELILNKDWDGSIDEWEAIRSALIVESLQLDEILTECLEGVEYTRLMESLIVGNGPLNARYNQIFADIEMHEDNSFDNELHPNIGLLWWEPPGLNDDMYEKYSDATRIAITKEAGFNPEFGKKSKMVALAWARKEAKFMKIQGEKEYFDNVGA